MMVKVKRTKKPPPPPPPPVEDQIKGLDDHWLSCRAMAHAYAEDMPYYKVEVEGGVRGALYVEEIRACMRCGVRRIFLYRVHDGWLEELSSIYTDRPKGYSLVGARSAERPIRQLINAERYRRAKLVLRSKV